MTKFETQSAMSLRNAIYTLLQRGIDGESPFVIEKDLAILAVRLECLNRNDVQTLVSVCDTLRGAIKNPDVSENPQLFQLFCKNTLENMLDIEATHDYTQSMRDEARQELVNLRCQHDREMRAAILEYISSYGRDAWIDDFAPLDDEE